MPPHRRAATLFLTAAATTLTALTASVPVAEATTAAATGSAYTRPAADSATRSHAGPAAPTLPAPSTGNDPHNASGAAFVRHLTNLGPAPVKATPAPGPSAGANPVDHKKKDGSSGLSTWLVVGVFFFASVGVGFLLSARRRRD